MYELVEYIECESVKYMYEINFVKLIVFMQFNSLKEDSEFCYNNI
jgi:hypothetical protein